MVSSQIENELYDICSYWHVPWWHSKLFWGLLLIGILGVFLYLVYWLLQKKRARALIKPSWQKALEALDRLRASTDYMQGQGRQVYFTLTAIVKNYMQERFEVEVVGKTDDELMDFVVKMNISPALVEALRTIFEGSLMVRFAQESAVKAQIDRDVACVYRLIEQTIPQK